MEQTERQKLAVERILQNQDHSVLEFPTGVGKTFTAMMLYQRLSNEFDLNTVHVVVPTNYLKNKWQKELHDYGVYQGEVYTMTAYAKMRYSYRDADLLIVDEVHNCAGDEARVLPSILESPAGFALGLSATLDTHQKSFLQEKGWTVADHMDLGEAVTSGYVPDYQVYNLRLRLTKDEQKQYDKADARYHHIMQFFSYDFDRMKNCLRSWDACENYLSALGPQGEEITTEQVYGYATQVMKAIRSRKDIIHGAQQKARAISRINDLHNEKGIVFGQTNAFANELEDYMDDVIAYHSGHSTYQRKKRFEKFMEDRKVNFLATSRIFNEGVDLPELNLSVIASYNSNHRELVQRIGRLLRGTSPVIYVLYMWGTQEEKWLKKAQKKVPGNKIKEITVRDL